ncbi:ribokinase [Neisseria sp. Ec49-e6-T10]|uniref:ribokinase n=1 Tax=Neisseria sp. Ec49-e6-T10 TaxID=3140744 RepID=UPI003EBD1643
MRNVLVVGSVNMDLVTTVPKFPQPGETLIGEHFATYCGGKGANQAIAAARLGAKVSLIGAVGDDDFGNQLRQNLQNDGVNIQGVKVVENSPSGVAVVMVSKGHNNIVVTRGANAFVCVEDVLAHEKLFEQADVVLSQLEIPLDVVEAVADLAEKYQKPFILNPAPAKRLPKSLTHKVTLLTPNEHEFIVSLDLPHDTDIFSLFSYVSGQVVLTRGEQGAYFCKDGGLAEYQSGFQVDVVDSTGAGDTFNGALAVYYHLGLNEAVKRACAAGALSVTAHGAQTGMPTEETLLSFLAKTI